MSMHPGNRGQGWVEYLLFLILVVLLIWILWTLLGPAITTWIRGFLNGV